VACAVEEQRVLHPLPRQPVEPALAVVQVPERDPRDDIGVVMVSCEALTGRLRWNSMGL
jgi:hypothetical protein